MQTNSPLNSAEDPRTLLRLFFTYKKKVMCKQVHRTENVTDGNSAETHS